MSTIVETAELGRRLRALRLDRRMTLKQVEVLAELSATHLSEIERGRTSPTIGALVRVARALGKDASYFIESEERTEIQHQPAERLTARPLPPGVSCSALTTGIPGSKIFSYRIEFSGGTLSLEPQEIPGDATYLVRRGEIEARFGDVTTLLAEGDAAQSTFDLKHRLRSAKAADAEVVAILSRPLPELMSEGGVA